MMKMVDNYLSNLGSYLPEAMQHEVCEELKASILDQLDDMSEQLGREPNEQEQAELLLKIGHPMKVAASYLPNQQLIGNEIFPMYKKVLVTMLVVVFGFRISLAVPWLFGEGGFISAIRFAFGSLVETGLWVFTLVTCGFYLAQRKGIALDKLYAWSPFELKQKATRLPANRIDTLLEVIMEIAFLGWWNDLLTLPGSEHGAHWVKGIALSPEWQSVLWPINLLLGVVILINLHKIWIAGWNKANLFATLLVNLAFFLVACSILGFDQLVVLNPEQSLAAQSSDILRLVQHSLYGIVGVVAATNLFEIVLTARRIRRR